MLLTQTSAGRIEHVPFKCHADASLKLHVKTFQTRIRRLRDNGSLPFRS